MPKEGISRREYRIRKFGGWERSMQLDANIVATGKDEGILFDFDRMERTPNTLDAHRLIWLADMDGVRDAVVEALFRAYFTEGRDISNSQTLIDVVAEAGLDKKRAETVLDGDEGMEAIRESGEQAQRLRVDSVPFFVVNGKITLSGAQQPDPRRYDGIACRRGVVGHDHLDGHRACLGQGGQEAREHLGGVPGDHHHADSRGHQPETARA